MLLPNQNNDSGNPQNSEPNRTPPSRPPVEGASSSVEGEEDYTLNLNGTDVKVPLSKLREHAQKHMAGEDLLKKHSDLKKDAEKGRYYQKMVDTMKEARGRNPEAIRALAKFPELDMTVEKAEQLIEAIQYEAQGGHAVENSEEEQQGEPTELDVLKAELAEVKKVLSDTKGKMVAKDTAETENALRQKIAQELDSHKEMGDILRGRPKAKKRLVEYALASLKIEARQTGRYTPDGIQRALMKTQEYAGDLGLLGAEDNSTVPGFPGLSRSPASPNSSILRRASEPPRRIGKEKALNTEDYAQNVADRLAYHMLGGSDDGDDET